MWQMWKEPWAHKGELKTWHMAILSSLLPTVNLTTYKVHPNVIVSLCAYWLITG